MQKEVFATLVAFWYSCGMRGIPLQQMRINLVQKSLAGTCYAADLAGTRVIPVVLGRLVCSFLNSGQNPRAMRIL